MLEGAVYSDCDYLGLLCIYYVHRLWRRGRRRPSTVHVGAMEPSAVPSPPRAPPRHPSPSLVIVGPPVNGVSSAAARGERGKVSSVGGVEDARHASTAGTPAAIGPPAESATAAATGALTRFWATIGPQVEGVGTIGWPLMVVEPTVSISTEGFVAVDTSPTLHPQKSMMKLGTRVRRMCTQGKSRALITIPGSKSAEIGF